jgi:ankyrin repeat protein
MTEDEIRTAIHAGDVETLTRLLAEHPDLAKARIGKGKARTLLHVVADWPGYLPNGAAMVKALVDAGADVNARFQGVHTETPLHWAASNNDVALLDALIDAGADIEAPGAVIGGGTPLADATAFAQWDTARRLVERGAETTTMEVAMLGLLDRLENVTGQDEIDHAFWGACHGGQQRCAEYLLHKGADVNWIPDWERFTPLDAAQRSEAADLVQWLRNNGGKAA